MNEPADAATLTNGYEALRAQATGQMPATTPRGLGLCLSAGLPAWMKAWAPLTPRPAPTVPAPAQATSSHVAREVVSLLTEMALACRQGSAA